MKELKLVAAIFAVAFVAMACNQQKQEAQAGFDEIKAACDADKKDEANKKGADLMAKNEAFKKIVDAATPDVKDKSKINFCAGLLQSEIKMRLKH